MASIFQIFTKFQSTCLVFTVIYSLTISGHVGAEKLDTAVNYECAIITGYWPYTKCLDLVLSCPKGTLISIANGLHGRTDRWTPTCNAQYFNCGSRNNCCADLQQYHAIQMLQKDKNNLAKTCNQNLQCKYQWQSSDTTMGHNQYMLVSYRCNRETTIHSSRPTTTPHFTTKVVTIGPPAAAKKTSVDRGTSTVINTPLLLTTTQNISTNSIKYSNTLPKQYGVPMVAVVVPSAVLSIGVGIGIFIFCRKRCKRNERSMAVHFKSDRSQRNPTRANNNYDSISDVVENKSKPNHIVGCNELNTRYRDDIKTNDGYSSDVFSHTYFILDGQTRRATIEPELVPKKDTDGNSEANALDDDYNRIRFTQNRIRLDPNYDTMNKLPYVVGIEEKGEYDNMNGNQRRLSNDIDYSYINLHVRDDSVGKSCDTYSHLHISDDKKSFENVSDTVEY